MAKITYASMKLKINNSTKEIQVGDNKIEVLQYLPIEDKYDLVMITLQKSFVDNIYNPVLKEMYFHLFMMYMYTNITFTEKQKEDEYKLYDILESNGIIEAVINAIPEEEYNQLFSWIEEIIESTDYYRASAGAIVTALIRDLPENMQKAVDILQSFDPEKYTAIQEFAKAANGGRAI